LAQIYLQNFYGLTRFTFEGVSTGIDQDAPPSQIETVLRSVAGAIAGADPIRREVIRDALIRRLRRAGFDCASHCVLYELLTSISSSHDGARIVWDIDVESGCIFSSDKSAVASLTIVTS